MEKVKSNHQNILENKMGPAQRILTFGMINAVMIGIPTVMLNQGPKLGNILVELEKQELTDEVKKVDNSNKLLQVDATSQNANLQKLKKSKPESKQSGEI